MSLDTETIPIMTHPLSRAWDQPNTNTITIFHKIAVMSQETFKALAEYSCSIPSGVYEGKIWKARSGIGRWYLRWFTDIPNEERCLIHAKEILIN